MATPREISFNLGLGATPTAAVEDQDVSAELTKMYNAINSLALKLDEYTGSLTVNPLDRPYIPTATTSRAKYVNRAYKLSPNNLVATTIVNIYGGGVQAATVGVNAAHAIVLEDTAAGDYAPITLQGIVGGFVGLTVGAPYYLSGTPGTITATPTAQKIGFAYSSTELAFGYLI